MSDLLKAYFYALELKTILNGYEAGSKSLADNNAGYRTELYPRNLIDSIADSRRQLSTVIFNAATTQQEEIARIEEVHLQSGRMRGTLFGYKLTDDETSILEKATNLFKTNWDDADSFKAFTILSFYAQPFDLPLQKNIFSLTTNQLKRYFYYIVRQPYVLRDEDEKNYVDYYVELMDWLCELLSDTSKLPSNHKAMLAGIIHKQLTFGACYYLDRSTAEIVHRRERVIQAMAQNLPNYTAPSVVQNNSASDSKSTKIKIGIISRNLGDYTDTRALYAQFCAFDKSKYEIYWYSLDKYDATTIQSPDFFVKLHTLIDKARSLRGSGTRMAEQIINDDLDILYIGSAFSFGTKEIDLMLNHKLARIQIGTNLMVPGSSGLSSYDYFLIPEGDNEAQENYTEELTEKAITIPDPLLWYEKREPTPENPKITREALGIPEDVVLYCSGAAGNKQTPSTLRTWLKILDNVPNSHLLFYPFNPAWGGFYIGLTFLARLRSALKEFPNIDPSRIVIVREITPDEANCFINLCDVYLGSFPHAGATSAMLALVHRKPLLARRSIWLRSASDASFLKSIELEELIGNDNDDLTRIGIKLGLDEDYRKQMVSHIHEKMKSPAFFNTKDCSLRLEAIINQIIETEEQQVILARKG